MQQEQTLWVVAANDAAALAGALCGALGRQCMAAALLNWGRETGKQPDSHTKPSTQQANRDTHTAVHSLGQQSKMQTQQQGDLQCHRRCRTKPQGTPAHESSVARMPAIELTREERERALELQLLVFLDETEEVSQAWGAIGFPPGAYKPFWKDHPLVRL